MMESLLKCAIIAMVLLMVSFEGQVQGHPTGNGLFSDHKKQFKQQEHELKSLKCRPILQTINLRNQLTADDDLGDKIFFPEVGAIRRCDEKCSFCGSSKLGRPRGRCSPVPEAMEPKEFVVFYVERGQKHYRKLVAMEHTKCQCS